jgi:predicted negative regulator of RcsB-dependent stress response
MNWIEIVAIVATTILTVSLILGWVLKTWLKSELQALTVAVQLLNSSVDHFVEHQKDIAGRVERIDNFAHNNRERIVKAETRIDAAHNRFDSIENKKTYTDDN